MKLCDVCGVMPTSYEVSSKDCFYVCGSCIGSQSNALNSLGLKDVRPYYNGASEPDNYYALKSNVEKLRECFGGKS